MRIGLYFGSFNPIHTGHCIIASFICDNTDIDQVWFVVSPQNPFKASNSLLNEYHRLHLVNLAIDQDNRLMASDIEFKLPKPSFTVDTLTYLKEKYPSGDFSIIIGSDSYLNLHKWKNAEVILSSYRILVYPRPGFEVVEEPSGNITLVNAPLLDISSTAIRAAVKARKSIRYLVPDKVKEEIERTGYYSK
jgi:nicotinate-nucleotide adenylyltransferase